MSPSTSPTPSPALSSSDFPALPAAEPSSRHESQQPESPLPSTSVLDSKAQAKAERKAAKKAAAEERTATRIKLAQERAAAKAAEKERLALEKAAEKEKAAALKAEKEKAGALKAEKERAAREKVEADRAAKERSEKERLEKDRVKKEQIQKERADKEQERKAAAMTSKSNKQPAAKPIVQADPGTYSPPMPSTPTLPSTPKANRRGQPTRQGSLPALVEPVAQAPILAKMPKKNKPATKPIKIPKEDFQQEIHSTLVSATNSDSPQLPDVRTDSSNNSRAHSLDVSSEPMSLKDLLAEIDTQLPWMRLSEHPFFDLTKVNPAERMPLEYGPLVHALSALSVGGGSFANNMPSGSIDNAVSSFQQLLETLTQTISDLLRLLPRTTWDDSSSFDGVLRDMLKGDDFLEDGGEEPANQGKDDEVAQLTLALERRARWMEVQLSKLEELHRDINTAAVRAVLAFNDNGWDPHGFMPRLGNTLRYFERMGIVEEKNGVSRPMTVEELENSLAIATLDEEEAEAVLKESMRSLQALLVPGGEDEEF